MITVCIDTNIILRFLLKDNLPLYKQASKTFSEAEQGKYDVYIDEVVVAETVWVLSSHYHKPKTDITALLVHLMHKSWIFNSRKKIIIDSLERFANNNLSYIDSWVLAVCKNKRYTLKTLDKKLQKQS